MRYNIIYSVSLINRKFLAYALSREFKFKRVTSDETTSITLNCY